MISPREHSLVSFVKYCTFVFCFFAVFALYTTFAEAGVFQFADGDPKHLRALALAAVEGAEAQIDVAEKVNLDENYTPEDFGIENLGFLPNNPLYVFKSIRRGLTSAFTLDPVSQAELKLQFAAEKLLEAQELASREGTSENTITRALQNYEDELRGVDKEVRDVGSEGGEQSLELARSVMDSMTKYQKMLGSFDKTLSPEAFGTVQNIKDATAETFGAVFTLGEAGAISETLVSVLDTQSGSEFKNFKNAEILKEIADKAPLDAHEALQDVEDNVLNKLQVQLEQADEAQRAVFSDFVQDIGGSEIRHIEVINELEVRPISDNVRDAIAGVKEGVLAKTENRLETFTPEQKEKFLGHLAGGTLENIRVIKEIENSVAAGVFAGIEKVKTQATEQFKQNIEEAGTSDERRQEFTDSIERFHDAKSISVLEEIGALIPDDKKEFFNTLKQKAATEIGRDIANARNATQRQVIYKALSGDHPEDVAALQSFGEDVGVSSSMRGVLDGLRATQYSRVQNRAANITDANRLEKFEQEYQKYQTSFDEAPSGVRLESTFKDRRNVFDSPDRAYAKIADARASLTKLSSVIETLPFDVGFEDGHFDPAIQEIERMRAAAEKKLGVAETSIEYNDVGRAFGEAEAALQMAKNGLSMATGYKQGRKQEKQVPDFLPKDYYQDDNATTRSSVTRGFTIYNANEFNQFCAFTGGFLKGKARCEFADGRYLEVSGGVFPFRIPPEFVPQQVTQKQTDADSKQRPVGCPPVPPTFGNFCAGGKITNQFDARGCQLTPRCEYQTPSDPIDIERKFHPTDATLCGSFEGYQCRDGYYCDYSQKVSATDGFGTCKKGTYPDERVACQAEHAGWVTEASKSGGSQCVQKTATGCSNPFVYLSKEQCERGQNTDPSTYPGDANSCPGFAYGTWDAKGVRYCQLNTSYACDYNYPSYITNGANYKAENCPTNIASEYCNASTEVSCRGLSGCQWGIPAGNNTKMCYVSGKTGVCPSMPTVSTCPAGQKLVVSWGSSECGEYYTCTGDTPTTKQSWTQTTWKFTDGEQTSMILDRLDAEYQNYIAPIRAQCLTISKTKFAWKPGAGDDSATNWKNFGIPDCSGNADAASCGNTMCEMAETAQSCPTDCGGTGTGGGTPQCSDGKDNDSDGKIDYPSDPECYGKEDWDEMYGSTTGGGGGGMKSCFYPNTTKDGKHVGWTIWCESDYVNCHYGEPSGKAFDTTGVSLGAPSSCESGWTTGGSGGGCWTYMNETACRGGTQCRWTIPGSASNAYVTPYCEPISTVTTGTMQCSDGKDNDSDGQIDYPLDTGCYGKEDPDEAYSGTTTPYAGDANSCPSFAYSRWDSKGARYCQLNAERKCDYAYPSYMTNGANYKVESCPTTEPTGSNGGCGMYVTDATCRVMSACRWEVSASGTGGWCTTSSATGGTTGSTSCVSGQYWNGSSCVTSSTTQYSSDPATACVQAAGSWNSTTSYCTMPNQSSCPSGQYWSGSACVSTSTTDCTSGQYWNGSACVASSATTASSCSSGQYWNGSSCVANSSSTTDYSSMQSGCASAGGTWNSTSNYCNMPPTSSPSYSTSCPSGQYWSGSACVTSTPPATPTCASGEYWNGNSCQTSSTAPSSPPPPSPTVSTSCPSGQYWDGGACVTPPPPPNP